MFHENENRLFKFHERIIWSKNMANQVSRNTLYHPQNTI